MREVHGGGWWKRRMVREDRGEKEKREEPFAVSAKSFKSLNVCKMLCIFKSFSFSSWRVVNLILLLAIMFIAFPIWRLLFDIWVAARAISTSIENISFCESVIALWFCSISDANLYIRYWEKEKQEMKGRERCEMKTKASGRDNDV